MLIFFQDKTNDESGGDYFGRSDIEIEKVIVYLPLLESLFDVCRIANCGAAVDPENKRTHFSGAMLTVSVVCNSGHTFKWDSSTKLGTGYNQVASINVLLGSYNYLCGVNIKKVMYSCNKYLNPMGIY